MKLFSQNVLKEICYFFHFSGRAITRQSNVSGYICIFLHNSDHMHLPPVNTVSRDILLLQATNTKHRAAFL